MHQPVDDPGPQFRWAARSSSELEIGLDFTPPLLIARLTGRLTHTSRKPLRSILHDASTQRPERLVLDATLLSHCDEAGLAALANAINHSAAELPVGVAGFRRAQRLLLHRLCADRTQQLRTFETVAEAVDAMLAAPGAALPDQQTLLAEVRHLHRALLSRAAIDQAKGILMAVYGLEPDAAFAMLTWHSRNSRVPLRVLAEHFVAAVRRRQGGRLEPVTTDALLADIAAGLRSGKDTLA
ncbi:ANTAR domain-containing protein [Kribbella monticola]|uniref:ANTAR domain-containing protein n=1 Tax=Kribbella monticola TaxID=2185285 RepID=UPI0018E5A868|nr:ANTAR domain-containing protein [Kribbella monticola]